MFKLIAFTVLIGIASAQYVRPYQTAEGGAEIRSWANDINPDGSYRFAFDTTNGISVQEQGVGGRSSQGTFSYVSPEGIPIQVSFTADENGYHPSGAHIRRN